jgi:hypothetical protein
MIFILVNKQKVKNIPVAKLLIAGFHVLLAGYVLAIFEGIFWKDFLNFSNVLEWRGDKQGVGPF